MDWIFDLFSSVYHNLIHNYINIEFVAC